MPGGFSGSKILQSSPLENIFFLSCPGNLVCRDNSLKVKISISMNFVAKCCQPPGILGDFAVDRWKFIDFTMPGILSPSPVRIKNGIAHYVLVSGGLMLKFIPRTSDFANFCKNSFRGPRISRTLSNSFRGPLISRTFAQVRGVRGIHLANKFIHSLKMNYPLSP